CAQNQKTARLRAGAIKNATPNLPGTGLPPRKISDPHDHLDHLGLLPGGFQFTASPSHRLTVSPSHRLTASPSHPPPVSPPPRLPPRQTSDPPDHLDHLGPLPGAFQFPASPSHRLPVSPSHRLTASPSHRLTVSPSHRLTVSPSHRLTVSPSHRLIAPFPPTLP